MSDGCIVDQPMARRDVGNSWTGGDVGAGPGLAGPSLVDEIQCTEVPTELRTTDFVSSLAVNNAKYRALCWGTR